MEYNNRREKEREREGGKEKVSSIELGSVAILPHPLNDLYN